MRSSAKLFSEIVRGNAVPMPMADSCPPLSTTVP
jgi:hypothetical protein